MRIFFLSIFFITSLFAREYIAIIDFEGIGISNDEARALTQRLTSEMITLEVYQVLERSEMKRLLDEQKFQYSGCVDLNCAVELGKMLGAKYMVVGTISKMKKTFTIDSRLIYVESSEAYSSGQYTNNKGMGDVIKNGIKSIAYQLCELEYVKEKFSFKETIKKNLKKIFAVTSILIWIYWGWMPPPI